MKNQAYLLFFFLFSLASCSSLVNEVSPDKIPKSESRLVINGYISPQDTLLAVKVQRSNGIFKTDLSNNFGNELLETTAKVILSQGNKSIELKYDPKNLLYLANPKDFKIISGLTYTLKVTEASGKIYTSETTVPSVIDFEILKVTKEKNNNNFGGSSYNVPIKWEAPNNSYFRFGAFIKAQTEFTDFNGKKNTSINEQRTLLLIDNKSTTNKVFTETLKPYEPYSGSFNGSNNNSAKVLKSSIKFFHSDKNYYLYHDSIKKTESNGNPFAEPTLVFTNITNGFGCFGSYASVEKEFCLCIK
jgi:Domain of unknown function (DUF4249)